MDNQFTLLFDDTDLLLQKLSSYSIVRIFIDESVNEAFYKTLYSKLVGLGKKVNISVIAPCYAVQGDIDNFRYINEDFVICIGKLHLQSIVKYYAYANCVEYAIIPVQEIAEYSFSKYAFIKDDKFCFYNCDCPQFAFIVSDFFSDTQIRRLFNILTYKNIVFFEKEWSKNILKADYYKFADVLKDINNSDCSLKNTAQIYAYIGTLLNTIKTYELLGAEYTVLSLLCINKKSIIDNLESACNLLSKFYECLIKFDIIKVEPNVNNYILKLKKIFNIDFLKVVSFIKPIYLKDDIVDINYKIKAYWPYLKSLYYSSKDKYLGSIAPSQDKYLEAAFALSSGTSSNNNILRFAYEFGYFERIIKFL